MADGKTIGATILVRWPKGTNLEVADVVAVDESGMRHKLRVTSVFLGDAMGTEMAACHKVLDGCGMPFEDHGEERPLTLRERIECLVAEYNEAENAERL